MTDTLLFEILHDHIGVITFNRPAQLNALNLATMRRFALLIDELSQDTNLRVLILCGAGQRAFCSGGDLNELAGYSTEEDGHAMISLMGDALLALERLPIPVIAAINGYALGGGSEIATACDLRIVDEKARLGFVQMRMAVTTGWGAGQRLLRLVGYSRAMDLLLRGHVMHSHEIESLGLAHSVVPEGTALEHALNFARQIAQMPPRVVHGVKALLQAGLNHPYEEALRIERDIFPPLWADEPHLKAVEDFLTRQREYEAEKKRRANSKES